MWQVSEEGFWRRHAGKEPFDLKLEQANTTGTGRTGDGALGKEIKKYKSLNDDDPQSAG